MTNGLDSIGQLRSVRRASCVVAKGQVESNTSGRREDWKIRVSDAPVRYFPVDSCPRGALKCIRVNGSNPRPHAPCRYRSHDIHLFPTFPCLTFLPVIISRTFFLPIPFSSNAFPKRNRCSSQARSGTLVPPHPAHHKQQGKDAHRRKQRHHCHATWTEEQLPRLLAHTSVTRGSSIGQGPAQSSPMW